MTLKKDKAGNIREGEQLEIEKIEKYLRSNIEGIDGDLELLQFPGGASNLTYLLKFNNRQMVMRRPPFGANIKSAHDMGREYKVLTALSKGYGKAPSPLLYESTGEILGCEFYIMERVEGIILRGQDGSDGSISPGQVGMIANGLLDALVELHDLDYEAIGLGDLGRPDGYVERQVTGWMKRYNKSKTDDHSSIEFVGLWLAENMPKEGAASIIHNDYKHDNVVLDQGNLSQVIALLDWEMCTLGDPLMDMGTALSYWINPEDPELLKQNFPNPSMLEGNPKRSELAGMYEQKSGRKMDYPIFYYAFGLFKTAVILQQIYARYKKGFTTDARFKHFDQAVAAFGLIAEQAIKRNRLDDLF